MPRDYSFYDLGLSGSAGAQVIIDHILTNGGNASGSHDTLSEDCALCAYPSVRSLDIGHNSLRDDGVRTLVKFLLGDIERIRALEELNLATNHITDAGLDCIVDLISHPETNLRCLWLQHNHLGHTSPSSRSLVRFSSAIASNLKCKLRVLSLTNNVHLSDSGVAPLLAALSEPRHVPRFQDQDADRGHGIGTSKPSWSSLAELHLNQCGLSDASADALVELIERNPILDALRLSGNHLTEHSLGLMAHALQSNSTLRYLESYGNDTGQLVIYQGRTTNASVDPISVVIDARTEIDRYCKRNQEFRKHVQKAGLQMLVPGRVLLHALERPSTTTDIFSLPPEIQEHIIRVMDTHNLLSQMQWIEILRYIQDRSTLSQAAAPSADDYLSMVNCERPQPSEML